MGFLNFVFRYPSMNVLVLGLLISIHGFILVQSQSQDQPPQLSPPPPPPAEIISPPPPPFPTEQLLPTPESGITPPATPISQLNPPPPPLTPSPPNFNDITPPPPPSPSPPPPPPPPTPSPPPPPSPISIPPPPPPPHKHASPPQSNRNQPRRLRPPSPPPPPPPPARTFKQSEKNGLNTGKTVGLVFAGFAAMLQICVVAFLVFKRKQLLRMIHTY